MSNKNVLISQEVLTERNVHALLVLSISVCQSLFMDVHGVKWICIVLPVSNNKYTAFNVLTTLKVNKWKHNCK